MPEELAKKVKAGFKTTEFWLSAAAMVAGMVVASGALAVDSPWGKAVGLIVTALAAMGYTASRAKAKAGK